MFSSWDLMDLSGLREWDEFVEIVLLKELSKGRRQDPLRPRYTCACANAWGQGLMESTKCAPSASYTGKEKWVNSNFQLESRSMHGKQ